MDMNQMIEQMGLFVVIGVNLAIWLVFVGAICLFVLHPCYVAIPKEHRKMEPGQVWLLLIPIFSIVWMFFVYPRLSKSFQSAYAAQGRNEGDCGEKLGLALCISVVLCMIPLVNCIAIPASLVLLILVCIKFLGLKKGLGQPPATWGGTH